MLGVFDDFGDTVHKTLLLFSYLKMIECLLIFIATYQDYFLMAMYIQM